MHTAAAAGPLRRGSAGSRGRLDDGKAVRIVSRMSADPVFLWECRKPGAHPEPGGTVFALRCARATRAWLMLFDSPTDDRPREEIELDPIRHRREGIWQAWVPDVHHGALYAWRIEAPDWDASRWVLDPCASAIATGRRWGETRGLTPGRWPERGAAFPKCVVVDDSRYDWHGDAPLQRPLSDIVVYEAHLRGYTIHSSSGVVQPGTYAGFAEKIPWLLELGVTAVEFLPLHEFDEMEFYVENGARRHLRNFWGYSPLAWFAPNSRYAVGMEPGAPVGEFRDLVRALHAAGLEVWLDVVFNHTAEDGASGPVWSFKALDRELYYLRQPGDGGLADVTGCGNTVNANEPAVAELIVDCLRRWVRQFHVDGFRFDLAAALTRGPDGRPMGDPPLLARIAAEPALQHVKLVAEPWDASGLYQLGHFPGRRWLEWNGRFRDDVRRFWRGEPGTLGLLATRLAGSSDLFTGRPRGPLTSVNYIACHDGFTLADVVAYTRPRNEANGEGGRDGERHNHSFNCGVEGPTDDPAVLAFRRRQQKNLLATLLLAQGVPMLLAGDEFGRTQQGNNNAYAQDNGISWVDWSLADRNRDLLDWTRQLVRLRRRHRSLRRTRFLTGRSEAASPPDIEWFGPDGRPPDWDHGGALGFRLSGDPRCTGVREAEPDLLVLIAGRAGAVRFYPPHGPWRLELCSAEEPPAWDGAAVVLDGPAVAVWSGPVSDGSRSVTVNVDPASG